MKKDYCDICGCFENIFQGYNCVNKSGDYLYLKLSEQANKNKATVYVFAHNFQGYDGHFIIQDLFKRDFISIEPIMNGSKILKIDIRNVKLLDSLSFFMMPLANLPKAFGFEDKVVKGFFPIHLNNEEIMSYSGSILLSIFLLLIQCQPISMKNLKYGTSHRKIKNIH